MRELTVQEIAFISGADTGFNPAAEGIGRPRTTFREVGQKIWRFFFPCVHW